MRWIATFTLGLATLGGVYFGFNNYQKQAPCAQCVPALLTEIDSEACPMCASSDVTDVIDLNEIAAQLPPTDHERVLFEEPPLAPAFLAETESKNQAITQVDHVVPESVEVAPQPRPVSPVEMAPLPRPVTK